MKILFVGNLIFLVAVVQSFAFPHPPAGLDFPPFSHPLSIDSFFGDVEKAFSSASASSLADGFGDFSKPGHRCSGKSGFPDRHDAFDMNEGSAHREHGHEEGSLFEMGDINSGAGASANAGAAGDGASHFLEGGGASGGAAAAANAVAGTDVGDETAKSVTQTKSETFTSGDGAFSSASAFSKASDA